MSIKKKKHLIKYPSAFIPVILSLAVLTWILILLSMFGIPKQVNHDEGTAAHIFQLWLVFEALMVTYFAVKYLPKKPNEALLVLAIQIIAVVVACAPVFILGF